MTITMHPSKPFSNGMEYEFFLENFCHRCMKHKEREDGFCAFVEDGGCSIENAMEDARFDPENFPCVDIVMLKDGDEVKYFNICRSFESRDKGLMNSYRKLFNDKQEEE